MASLNGTIKRDLPTALGGHQEQEGSLGGFKHPGAPLPLTLLLNLWVVKRPNLGRTGHPYLSLQVLWIQYSVCCYGSDDISSWTSQMTLR